MTDYRALGFMSHKLLYNAGFVGLRGCSGALFRRWYAWVYMVIKEAKDLVAQAKLAIMEVAIESAPSAIDHCHLLIDVREPAEYEAGHIEGAVSIPRGLLEFTMSGRPEFAARNLNILVYCKTSSRAALAAQSLMLMGYKNVQSIGGGLEAWVAAGNAVHSAQ